MLSIGGEGVLQRYNSILLHDSLPVRTAHSNGHSYNFLPVICPLADSFVEAATCEPGATAELALNAQVSPSLH